MRGAPCTAMPARLEPVRERDGRAQLGVGGVHAMPQSVFPSNVRAVGSGM